LISFLGKYTGIRERTITVAMAVKINAAKVPAAMGAQAVVLVGLNTYLIS
jgi:hypothetical protein